MKKLLFILASSLSIISCGSDGGGGPAEPISREEAESIMNQNIKIGVPFFQVNEDEVEIDDTIEITGSGSNQPMPINPSSGGDMNAQITFNAPNGNVIAVGMRFGISGPINFVPVDDAALGQISVTATVPFGFDPSICDKLSSICHDIRCYEFAQTSSGKITKSNITNIAMLCGDCSEPSCKGLVDEAACLDGSGGGGSGGNVGDCEAEVSRLQKEMDFYEDQFHDPSYDCVKATEASKAYWEYIESTNGCGNGLGDLVGTISYWSSVSIDGRCN